MNDDIDKLKAGVERLRVEGRNAAMEGVRLLAENERLREEHEYLSRRYANLGSIGLQKQGEINDLTAGVERLREALENLVKFGDDKAFAEARVALEAS